MAIAVRVDDKGRLTIPGKLRKELDVKPGDTFFLQREGEVLRYAKATNPFDMLAEQAAQHLPGARHCFGAEEYPGNDYGEKRNGPRKSFRRRRKHTDR
jgi:AbrB family looped-hinge helix DNA binding protein